MLCESVHCFFRGFPRNNHFLFTPFKILRHFIYLVYLFIKRKIPKFFLAFLPTILIFFIKRAVRAIAIFKTEEVKDRQKILIHFYSSLLSITLSLKEPFLPAFLIFLQNQDVKKLTNNFLPLQKGNPYN